MYTTKAEKDFIAREMSITRFHSNFLPNRSKSTLKPNKVSKPKLDLALSLVPSQTVMEVEQALEKKLKSPKA